MTENPAPEVPAAVMARARGEAWKSVEDERAVEMLRRYYDPAGDYAGSTFLGLEPNDPTDITATDLYALSLLSIHASPRAGRLLLEPGAHRDRVLAALRDPHLGPEVALETATASTLAAAGELYLALRDALGVRPWVTASKLCTRKRPLFFPVRDSVVTTKRLGLGLSYLLDWQVSMSLLADVELVQQLQERAAHAQDGVAFEITDPALRILDVLLWMTADASMRPRRQGRGAR